MKTFDHPETPCPYCAGVLEAATPAKPDEPEPEPGDITICFTCAGILVFGHDLSPREPSRAELEAALEVDGVKELQAQISLFRAVPS